jgi:hypothetical protein
MFCFFLGISVWKNSKIFGVFSGIMLLFMFFVISSDGVEVPYGYNETIDTNLNKTIISQNFVNVYEKNNIVHEGFGLVILGMSIFIIGANLFGYVIKK